MSIEKLVSHPPVETFSESVLRWLAWLNELNINTSLCGPGLKMLGPKLRLRSLEDENRRLKKLVADLSLDNQMLKEINEKKW